MVTSKSAFSGVGGWVMVQTNSTQSAKICPNLLFWMEEGGGPDIQTNSTQIAKICPNLHFQGCGWAWPRPTQPKLPRSVQICIFEGGVGGGQDQLNPKCQDLSKSAFGGGMAVQTSRPTQPKLPRSVQICIFEGGGGGWPRPSQPKVPRFVQICFLEGGGSPDIQTNSTQIAKICPNLHF